VTLARRTDAGVPRNPYQVVAFDTEVQKTNKSLDPRWRLYSPAKDLQCEVGLSYNTLKSSPIFSDLKTLPAISSIIIPCVQLYTLDYSCLLPLDVIKCMKSAQGLVGE